MIKIKPFSSLFGPITNYSHSTSGHHFTSQHHIFTWRIARGTAPVVGRTQRPPSGTHWPQLSWARSRGRWRRRRRSRTGGGSINTDTGTNNEQSAIKCHGGEHSNCLTSTLTLAVSIGETHHTKTWYSVPLDAWQTALNQSEEMHKLGWMWHN